MPASPASRFLSSLPGSRAAAAPRGGGLAAAAKCQLSCAFKTPTARTLLSRPLGGLHAILASLAEKRRGERVVAAELFMSHAVLESPFLAGFPRACASTLMSSGTIQEPGASGAARQETRRQALKRKHFTRGLGRTNSTPNKRYTRKAEVG